MLGYTIALSARRHAGNLESLQRLVTDIVSATSWSYEEQGSGRLPRYLCQTLSRLVEDIFSNLDYPRLGYRRDKLGVVTLKTWLAALEEAGVDLEFYGKLEVPLLQQLIRKTKGMEARFVGIHYGAKSQNWKLWWSEPTDEFAGDFWRGLEPERPLLPGSWIDDEEDDMITTESRGPMQRSLLWGFPEWDDDRV
jgi:hypothetical protein